MNLRDITVNGIKSELAIWKLAEVTDQDKKLYLGTSNYGIPLYFLPNRNLIVRDARPNGWQTPEI